LCHINFSHFFVFAVFPILFTHDCLLHTTRLNLWLWLLHTTTTALPLLCQSPGVCCPSMKPSFQTHKIVFWLFLKMKVAGSSHTLVTNFPSTQRHISQDVNCHQVIISYTQNHLLTLPEDEGSRFLPHIGY
jgi:hypothetical protein